MGTVCVETSGSGQSGLPGKRAKEFVGALDWARIRPGSNPVRNRARTLRVGGSSAERARLSPSGAADAKGLARAGEAGGRSSREGVSCSDPKGARCVEPVRASPVRRLAPADTESDQLRTDSDSGF